MANWLAGREDLQPPPPSLPPQQLHCLCYLHPRNDLRHLQAVECHRHPAHQLPELAGDQPAESPHSGTVSPAVLDDAAELLKEVEADEGGDRGDGEAAGEVVEEGEEEAGLPWDLREWERERRARRRAAGLTSVHGQTTVDVRMRL